MTLNLAKSVNEQSEEFLACGICWMPYTSEKRAPISLRCGHTICRACCEVLGKGFKYVECGICREKTFITAKKLTKNFDFMRVLRHFGHLQEDPKEEPKENGKGEEEKERQNGRARSPPPHEGNWARFGEFEGHPSHAENDVNMEAVDEIAHNMREAINTIRNEGDTLQVYAIENPDNMAAIQRRIEPVFVEISHLMAHPVRNEIYSMFHRAAMVRRAQDPNRNAPRLIHDFEPVETINVEPMAGAPAANRRRAIGFDEEDDQEYAAFLIAAARARRHRTVTAPTDSNGNAGRQADRMQPSNSNGNGNVERQTQMHALRETPARLHHRQLSNAMAAAPTTSNANHGRQTARMQPTTSNLATRHRNPAIDKDGFLVDPRNTFIDQPGPSTAGNAGGLGNDVTEQAGPSSTGTTRPRTLRSTSKHANRY